MGHPIRDPHGELIPTADLKCRWMIRLRSLHYAQADCHDPACQIRRPGPTASSRPAWTHPRAQLEVMDYSPYDHNLTVKAGRKTSVLGLNITNKIFIEEM